MKRLILMLVLTVTAGVMAVSCGTDEKLETLSQKLDELNQQMDQMQQDIDKLNDDIGVVGDIYENNDQFVDEPAVFYGGDAALHKFIYANLEMPEDAVDGTVIAGLTINKTGKVINVKLMKSVSASCDAAVLKVCYSLPDFLPAKIAGKPVSVSMNLPVKIRKSIK